MWQPRNGMSAVVPCDHFYNNIVFLVDELETLFIYTIAAIIGQNTLIFRFYLLRGVAEIRFYKSEREDLK